VADAFSDKDDKKSDAEHDEAAIAEARRDAEERRKEKHRKMEEEREKMRQDIRDKVLYCSTLPRRGQTSVRLSRLAHKPRMEGAKSFKFGENIHITDIHDQRSKFHGPTEFSNHTVIIIIIIIIVVTGAETAAELLTVDFHGVTGISPAQLYSKTRASSKCMWLLLCSGRAVYRGDHSAADLFIHCLLFFFCLLTGVEQFLYAFYRATLCVSAVLAVGRCLSVRHVRVLYPNGAPCGLPGCKNGPDPFPGWMS